MILLRINKLFSQLPREMVRLKKELWTSSWFARSLEWTDLLYLDFHILPIFSWCWSTKPLTHSMIRTLFHFRKRLGSRSARRWKDSLQSDPFRILLIAILTFSTFFALSACNSSTTMSGSPSTIFPMTPTPHNHFALPLSGSCSPKTFLLSFHWPNRKLLNSKI